MPRVYLTADERKAAKENRDRQAMLQSVADGLAAYRNRRGLSKFELGRELGLSEPTVVKLLTCKPVSIRTDALWRVFAAAGVALRGDAQ